MFYTCVFLLIQKNKDVIRLVKGVICSSEYSAFCVPTSAWSYEGQTWGVLLYSNIFKIVGDFSILRTPSMKFIIARIERNLYLLVDNWERKESKTFGRHIIHHNFIVFETCTFQVFPHSIYLVSFLSIELVYAEYFPNRKQDFRATCCSLKTTLTKKTSD